MRAKFPLANQHTDFAPYDVEKLDHLTHEIVGALKNAANIRGLGANESITVVLLGTREGSGMVFAVAGEKGESINAVSGEVHPATMTIKVKKSDAEAALNGSIDLAELQKRAGISVY